MLLFVACGGSSGSVSIPNVDQDGSDTDASGLPPDGTDNPKDSGVVCGPCETAPPSSACKGTGPCGCAPYTCPDAGGNNPPDAGPDAAPPDDSCVWSANSNPCGVGKYCSTENSNCGKGKCVAVGTLESQLRNPVCGCDGVTYWNSSLAAKKGMSLRKDGACTGNDARQCGGVQGASCKQGTKCNYRTQSDQCQGSDPDGVCWATPSSCPSIGTVGKLCGKNNCQFECGLINNEEPWYSVPPQFCQP